VINAFNRNMPFDQFTIEQLAGDLLPNPTLDQRIATGFQRCGATTNEGGAIEDEFAAIYAKDRVDTTSAVWLGLTLGCATCHDHKFDPLAQRDFYAMTAFYRNTTQPVMDGNIQDTPPVIAVPSEKDRPRWLELEAQRSDLRNKLKSLESAKDASFETWLQSPQSRALTQPLVSQLFALAGKLKVVPTLPKGIALSDSPAAGLKALQFGEKAPYEAPNIAAISADKPFTISVWFQMPKGDDYYVLASQDDPKDKGRGWSFGIGSRVPNFRLTGDDGKSISASTGFLEQTKAGQWTHLIVTYDGSRERAGIGMYWDGRPVTTQGGDVREPLKGNINTGQPLRIGNEGGSYFAGGAIAEFRIFDHAVKEDEARLLAHWPQLYSSRETALDQLSEDRRNDLRLYYLLHASKDYQALSGQLAAVNTERTTIARRSPVTLVMEERTDQQPFAFVLNRGMYDQPRDRVDANTPGVLPPMKPDEPHNRLGLARWLVSPENPLPARVTVNRYWQEIYGTGIVKTAEDFGSQGELPVNQELLDWMAVEFRESGWDTKKFFRLLLTSATYRQAAIVTPEKLKGDPENRLLSRGPRFRMDGEMVRDYALSASGLLSPQIGGPSVKPYQPDGIWEAVAMDQSNTRIYKRDGGDKLYRRSVYWFWKRSAPPASMDIFNAPTREICTVRRERTDTPLQALVTMNDPQFVEAARHLAERTLQKAANSNERFDFLGRVLLSRSFDDREVKVLDAAWRDFLKYYDSNPEDARKLLLVGESKAEASLNPAEVAAMTMVVNQVMNLDEVLVK
jgi:hypothetical protein